MYCPNCGKLNPQEDKFCMYCGAELIDNQNVPQQAVTPTVQVDWKSITRSCGKGWTLVKRYPQVSIPVMVLIVILVVYAFLNGVVYTPKNTVVRYFDAVQKENVESLYSCMDLPESQFISYDSFKRMWDQMDGAELQVSSYEITEAGKTRSASSVDPLMLLFGLADPDDYIDSSDGQEENSLVKTYLVNYHITGKDEIQSMQVRLIGEPVMGGLFKNYKVLSNYIVQDYSVTVPVGSTVTVDDIALTGGNTSQDGDVYTIPAIFQGEHIITVESSLGGISDTVFLSSSDYYGDSGYTCFYIPYSDATCSALFEQAKAQLNTIMAGAMTRQAWPDDVAVTTDPDEAEDVAYTYQRLQENLFNTERGSGYTSFQFTEIFDESDHDQSFSSDGARYTCAVDFKYNYTRRYVNWNDEVELNNGSSSGSAYLDYVYNNGTWQLCGLSIGY